MTDTVPPEVIDEALANMLAQYGAALRTHLYEAVLANACTTCRRAGRGLQGKDHTGCRYYWRAAETVRDTP